MLVSSSIGAIIGAQLVGKADIEARLQNLTQDGSALHAGGRNNNGVST